MTTHQDTAPTRAPHTTTPHTITPDTTPSEALPETTPPETLPETVGQVATWPVLLLAAPAFVAVWSGWVGLGSLTGFGEIQPLPGTPMAGWTLDTAITLPIGVETYAAFAMRVWLSGHGGPRAVAFARRSAIASLLLGAAGQVAYHLMSAAGITRAPWWITTVVATLPVAVLGMGAALAHLVRHTPPAPAEPAARPEPARAPATTPDTTPVTAPDGGPDTGPDADAGGRADVGADGGAVIGADARGAGRRTPARTRRATSTAERIARLRGQYPDMPTGEIARRVKVTERTVRRHLNGPGPARQDVPGSTGSADQAA